MTIVGLDDGTEVAIMDVGENMTVLSTLNPGGMLNVQARLVGRPSVTVGEPLVVGIVSDLQVLNLGVVKHVEIEHVA